MTIWYMRDNHTFLPLPLDVDKAMKRLRAAFIDELDTYGMLCTKEGPMKVSGQPRHLDFDAMA